MWISGILMLSTLLTRLVAAPLIYCPKTCTCTGTDLYCNSFSFMRKLMDIDASSVTKLVIHNSSANLNPNLKKFHNLKTIQLSANKIKQINSLYFPKSVEKLDISYNFITKLPHDLHSSLTSLKELRLNGNPISCTCDSLTIRDQLLHNNVTIVSPVKCHSPKNVYGKSWLTVSCANNLFDEMQGDAPYEGSGFVESVTEFGLEANEHDKSVEEEFIRFDSTPQGINANSSESDDDKEGSGDSTTSLIEIEDETDEDTVDTVEQSPVSEIPLVKLNDLLLHDVKACNFNCSTPPPLESDTYDLPPPSVFDGVKIVLDDFNILRGSDTTSTTTLPPHIASSENNKNTTNKSDAAFISNSISEEDKGSFVEETRGSNSNTYIFLGALLLLIIVLLVYAIYKKRSKNTHKHRLDTVDEKAATSNELELLSATKPVNGRHEILPLMNGHSEKEGPFENVEPRQKLNDARDEGNNFLVPEAKRVTIKATEIPNSTPKSPILVTRHLNSDGNIVTTPTVHQKV